MNIVLSGMMGSGKTTVAAALSSFGYVTVDIDALIVERYGEINAIFANQGEERFREIEAEVTGEVAHGYDGAVISLGGGCVLRKENVNNLKQSGKIFYLRATADTIINRLRGDATRPLLQGDLAQKVNAILASRSEIYEKTADVIIDTDGLTPAEIAIKIRETTL